MNCPYQGEQAAPLPGGDLSHSPTISKKGLEVRGRKTFCFLAALFLMGFSGGILVAVSWPRARPPVTPDAVPAWTLFRDPNCVSGCWSGLKPGVTTRSELEAFLQNSPSISLKDETNLDHGLTGYNARTATDLGVTATTELDTLFSINLSGRFDHNLESAIAVLGTPGYVLLDYRITPTGGIEGTGRLYFPDKGYILQTVPSIERKAGNVSICLKGENPIQSVAIYEPSPIGKLMLSSTIEYAPSLTENDIQYELDKLVPWPGFTCVAAPVQSAYRQATKTHSTDFRWPLAILTFGLLAMGSGLRIVIVKEVAHTKRGDLLGAVELLLTGHAAAVYGLSNMLAGLVMVFWALFELSGKEITPFQGLGTACVVWLIPIFWMSIEERMRRRNSPE
jgi:hypothetical protein